MLLIPRLFLWIVFVLISYQVAASLFEVSPPTRVLDGIFASSRFSTRLSAAVILLVLLLNLLAAWAVDYRRRTTPILRMIQIVLLVGVLGSVLYLIAGRDAGFSFGARGQAQLPAVINQPLWMVGLAVLFLGIILTADPGLQRSRLRAYLRRISQSQRHRDLRARVSPTTDRASQIRSFLLKDRPLLKVLGLTFFLFFPIGIAIALLALGVIDIPPETLALDFAILLIIGIFLFFFALFIHYISGQKTHVVKPFEVVSSIDNTLELQRIAALATDDFAENLQRIATILNRRQSEALNTREDSALQIFVTSGASSENIRQLQSVANIEAEIASTKAKFPLGNFFAALASVLIETEVRGQVLRHKDSTVEITAELHQRRGSRQSILASATILAEGSENFISREAVQKAVSELAVKMVSKLTQSQYVASSWESLQLLLEGLEASRSSNWWWAVDRYRRAIHQEETHRRSFGLGHYHLGAALIFQGHTELGLEHLNIAEASGPPLPEVYYMQALTLLYQHWGELTEQVIDDIVRAARKAIELRKDFAEAYFLLGSLYYQVGKEIRRQHERMDEPFVEDKTNTNVQDEQKKPGPAGYRRVFRISIRYLRKAVRLYEKQDKTISSRQSSLLGPSDTRISTLSAAYHQMADALRSMEYFDEAESYYVDTLAAYPSNLRTLSDMAKMMCLEKDWQRANKWQYEKLMYRADARTNPDVTFFVGWAMLHCSLQRPKLLQRWVRSPEEPLEPPLPGEQSRDPQEERERSFLADMKEFLQAFWYLDYTLHQRPHYAKQWTNRKWLEFFKTTSSHFQKTGSGKPYQCGDRISCPDRLPQALYDWIAWRIEGFGFDLLPEYYVWKNENPAAEMKGSPDACSIDQPELFEHLKSFRCRFAQKLYDAKHAWRVGPYLDDNHLSLHSPLLFRWQCLDLAKELSEHWKSTTGSWDKFLTDMEILPCEYQNRANRAATRDPISLNERKAMDTLLEVSLLLCRLLSEGEAYEFLFTVAKETIAIIDRWSCRWERLYDRPEWFRFSPIVYNYQIASLYSWQAYAGFQKVTHTETMVRLHASGEQIDDTAVLNEALNLVNTALYIVKEHPLARFVRAQIFRKQIKYREAADELFALLAVETPFDPLMHVVRIEKAHTREWHRPNRQTENNGQAKIKLRDMENVCGQFQFESILDPAHLHLALAELFCEIKEYQLAIDHVFTARMLAPYIHLDARCSVLLAELLEQAGRYQEADIVLDDSRNLSRFLSPLFHSGIDSERPKVMECIIRTRLGWFADSLMESQRLQLELDSHLPGYEEAVRELMGRFEQALQTAFTKNKEALPAQIIKGQEQQVTLDRMTSCLINAFPGSQKDRMLRLGFVFYKTNGNAIHIDAEPIPPKPDRWLLSFLGSRRGQRQACIPENRHLLLQVWQTLTGNRKQTPEEFSPDFIKISQLLYLIVHSAHERHLLHLELTNNHIFNIIEGNPYLSTMQELSSKNANGSAGNTNHRLLTKEGTPADEVVQKLTGFKEEIKLLQQVYTHLPVEAQTPYRDRLAHYYDTVGWAHYRMGEPELAEKYLKQEAVQLNQETSFVDYHLARVYLRLLETRWMAILGKKPGEIDNQKLHEISDYLKRARHHWHNASRHDESQDFSIELRIMYQDLEEYTENLKKITG